MKLAWTRLAIADLHRAHDFIAAESPRAASSVIDRIEKSAAMLLRHPLLGRPGRVEGTRELIVVETPFVIPYRVKGDRIQILAVIHGARRWPDLL